MKLLSASFTISMLLALDLGTSHPMYTVRHRGTRKAVLESARQERLRTRALGVNAADRMYEKCGKSGGKSGKSGKSDRRDLTGCGCPKGVEECIEYGDPLDDPIYFPTPSPTVDDNNLGLTEDDETSPPTMVPMTASPTTSPIVTLAPVVATPSPVATTPAPVSPVPTESPTPGGTGLRDDSGSNESVDVDLEYDEYVPSGSNDAEDTDDAPPTQGFEDADFSFIPTDDAIVPSNDGN